MFSATKLFVACNSLKFENTLIFQPFEPLFFSLALYDIEARVKISETFHFNFNQVRVSDSDSKNTDCFILPLSSQEWGMDYFANDKDKLDVETMATKAYFTLHNVNPNVYLVLRIERFLLTAEVDKDLSFYTKNKNVVTCLPPPPQISIFTLFYLS